MNSTNIQRENQTSVYIPMEAYFSTTPAQWNLNVMKPLDLAIHRKCGGQEDKLNTTTEYKQQNLCVILERQMISF